MRMQCIRPMTALTPGKGALTLVQRFRSVNKNEIEYYTRDALAMYRHRGTAQGGRTELKQGLFCIRRP